MKLFLFSLDIKAFLFLAIIFTFLVPIVLIKVKNKLLLMSYVFIYFTIIILGVFSYIEVSYMTISFSILFTHSFFTNHFSIFSFDLFGIIINLFLLFPLGFSLPLLKKSTNYYTIAIISFIISFSIEILQYILPIIRYPELLDTINNVISAILGYSYYLFLKGRLDNDRISKQKKRSKS